MAEEFGRFLGQPLHTAFCGGGLLATRAPHAAGDHRRRATVLQGLTAAARNIFVGLQCPKAGPVAAANGFEVSIKFSENPPHFDQPVPLFGAHIAVVYRGLPDLSDKANAVLKARGVIWKRYWGAQRGVPYGRRSAVSEREQVVTQGAVYVLATDAAALL